MRHGADLAAVVTAIAAVIALAGAYVQFALRRAVFPCVEFDVDFVVLRSDSARKVGDVVVSVRNVGPGAGFVANVQGRVRYSLDGEAGTARDAVEPAFAHLVRPAAAPDPAGRMILGTGGFLFAPRWDRAFIQPGVTQFYRKPLALPGDAVLIHVWAAFEYHIPVGRLSSLLARIVIHPDERRTNLDYTVRRTFTLDGERQRPTGQEES